MISRLSLANTKLPHQRVSDAVVRLHASAVWHDGEAWAIIGAPGSGKSAYAAYLVASGAVLIADDQLLCTQTEGALRVAPPENIAGILAVRGLGIMRTHYKADIPLSRVMVLSADLLHQASIVRIIATDLPCHYVRVPAGAYYVAHGLFAQARRDGALLAEDWMPSSGPADHPNGYKPRKSVAQ
jgi:hypothetical protein